MSGAWFTQLGRDGAALAAAGMLAAESQLRRVKGYQQLLQLAHALGQATAGKPGLLDLTA